VGQLQRSSVACPGALLRAARCQSVFPEARGSCDLSSGGDAAGGVETWLPGLEGATERYGGSPERLRQSWARASVEPQQQQQQQQQQHDYLQHLQALEWAEEQQSEMRWAAMEEQWRLAQERQQRWLDEQAAAERMQLQAQQQAVEQEQQQQEQQPQAEQQEAAAGKEVPPPPPAPDILASAEGAADAQPTAANDGNNPAESTRQSPTRAQALERLRNRLGLSPARVAKALQHREQQQQQVDQRHQPHHHHHHPQQQQSHISVRSRSAGGSPARVRSAPGTPSRRPSAAAAPPEACGATPLPSHRASRLNRPPQQRHSAPSAPPSVAAAASASSLHTTISIGTQASAAPTAAAEVQTAAVAVTEAPSIAGVDRVCAMLASIQMPFSPPPVDAADVYESQQQLDCSEGEAAGGISTILPCPGLADCHEQRVAEQVIGQLRKEAQPRAVEGPAAAAAPTAAAAPAAAEEPSTLKLTADEAAALLLCAPTESGTALLDTACSEAATTAAHAVLNRIQQQHSKRSRSLATTVPASRAVLLSAVVCLLRRQRDAQQQRRVGLQQRWEEVRRELWQQRALAEHKAGKNTAASQQQQQGAEWRSDYMGWTGSQFAVATLTDLERRLAAKLAVQALRDQAARASATQQLLERREATLPTARLSEAFAAWRARTAAVARRRQQAADFNAKRNRAILCSVLSGWRGAAGGLVDLRLRGEALARRSQLRALAAWRQAAAERRADRGSLAAAEQWRSRTLLVRAMVAWAGRARRAAIIKARVDGGATSASAAGGPALFANASQSLRAAIEQQGPWRSAARTALSQLHSKRQRAADCVIAAASGVSKAETAEDQLQLLAEQYQQRLTAKAAATVKRLRQEGPELQESSSSSESESSSRRSSRRSNSSSSSSRSKQGESPTAHSTHSRTTTTSKHSRSRRGDGDDQSNGSSGAGGDGGSSGDSQDDDGSSGSGNSSDGDRGWSVFGGGSPRSPVASQQNDNLQAAEEQGAADCTITNQEDGPDYSSTTGSSSSSSSRGTEHEERPRGEQRLTSQLPQRQHEEKQRQHEEKQQQQQQQQETAVQPVVLEASARADKAPVTEGSERLVAVQEVSRQSF